MKRKFLVCAMLAAAIPLTAVFGCAQEPRSIVSIDKSESIGLVDYYTITYSDGTTSSFTVTNGKDGQNGNDGQDAPAITLDQLYEYYKQVDPDITKEQFIEKFLTIDGGTSEENLTALSSAFRSSLKVYTVFREKAYNPYSAQYFEYDNYCSGSAVIYQMGGEYTYLLTNYHVIYDDNAVSDGKTCYKAFAYMYGSDYEPVRSGNSAYGDVIVNDDFALNCEYVGGSVECDSAILRVKTAELKAVYPFAQAVTVNTNYEVGQVVYALGNLNDCGISLTRGIISVDIERAAIDLGGKTRYYYLLRTDADLYHGSSGCGLFNADGEFIALCNSGYESIQSINNAIPASTATVAADNIIYYHLAGDATHNGYRLLLGVTVTESNCRYVYDAETESGNITADILITEPDEGAENPVSGQPAQLMGLQAGDIIRAVNINGKAYQITRMFRLNEALMLVKAGDSVTVTYERGGETYESQAYAVTAADLTAV